jgi:hypothetical protein
LRNSVDWILNLGELIIDGARNWLMANCWNLYLVIDPDLRRSDLILPPWYISNGIGVLLYLILIFLLSLLSWIWLILIVNLRNWFRVDPSVKQDFIYVILSINSVLLWCISISWNWPIWYFIWVILKS